MSRRRARRQAARAQAQVAPRVPTYQEVGKSIYSTWTGSDGSWKTLSDLLGLQGVAGPTSLHEALRNTAFLLCSDIVAQDISKAKLRMYRKVGDDRRVEVKPKDHSLAELLALDPNPEHTWMDFWDMVIRHFAISQNAFIAKKITTRGDIRALIPIVPGRVQVLVYEAGGVFYQVARSTMFEHMLLNDFPDRMDGEDMVHVKGRLYDGLQGYSSLLAGAGALSLAAAVQTYQDRLYSGGGRYKIAFTLNEDKEMSNEQFQRLRGQFKEIYRKTMDSDEPLLLENGADVKTLMMTAKDSEIAVAVKNSLTDICRLFRMPPHKVMHFDGIKYENMDSAERMYVSDSLVPTAMRFEAALERALLTRSERLEYCFEFDREMMAASDLKTRAEVVKIGVQTGVVTVNEARRDLGYDKLEGDAGDVRSIPVNVTLVDGKNKPVLDGAAGAPGDNPTTDPLQQPANPPK
ncbi:phage portal protein [uncultured Alsobacter sp.]|uniref:phage portal protein n=1 Tax=uncultured Alsobacter sp. TaxID=1748258 RepID=UPI0025F06BAB|nr:phage portal protein [uncultured Alsobacter sp.]